MNANNRTMEYLISTMKEENAESDSELEINLFEFNICDSLKQNSERHIVNDNWEPFI